MHPKGIFSHRRDNCSLWKLKKSWEVRPYRSILSLSQSRFMFSFFSFCDHTDKSLHSSVPFFGTCQIQEDFFIPYVLKKRHQEMVNLSRREALGGTPFFKDLFQEVFCQIFLHNYLRLNQKESFHLHWAFKLILKVLNWLFNNIKLSFNASHMKRSFLMYIL